MPWKRMKSQTQTSTTSGMQACVHLQSSRGSASLLCAHYQLAKQSPPGPAKNLNHQHNLSITQHNPPQSYHCLHPTHPTKSIMAIYCGPHYIFPSIPHSLLQTEDYSTLPAMMSTVPPSTAPLGSTAVRGSSQRKK